MGVTYRPAKSVERIATSLIARHHTDLVDVRIVYVFRSESARSNGKIVYGTARKLSGLNAYLAQDIEPGEAPAENDLDFFVIEISEPVWSELATQQREALVDHELSHCRIEVVEKDGYEFLELKMRAHDLEEFRDVVDRHGLWRPDVEAFAATIAKVEGRDR